MRSTLVTALLGLQAACVASTPQAEPVLDEDAIALLVQVREQDYRTWPQPPRPDDAPEGPLQARGPHGAYVLVYLSPLLEDARTADQTLESWPVGSMVVCEGYDDPQGEPTLYMIGRRDTDAWTWAQLTGGETPIVSGRPAACVACHGGGQDHLRSIKLPKGG